VSLRTNSLRGNFPKFNNPDLTQISFHFKVSNRTPEMSKEIFVPCVMGRENSSNPLFYIATAHVECSEYAVIPFTTPISASKIIGAHPATTNLRKVIQFC